MIDPAIHCKALSKIYGTGDARVEVLSEANLSVEKTESCLLLGPSGSGKTTLLSILGCLLTPNEGSLSFSGEKVDFQSPASLVKWRCNHLGFIFQQAHLLSFFTARENLEIIARNAGLKSSETKKRIDFLMGHLGVDQCANRVPGELSGGQRQRVAVCRALIHRPKVVLADEPTAALDWQIGEAVIDLLITEAAAAEATLVVVTHDTRLIPKFDRVFEISNGNLLETAEKNGL